MQDWAYSFEPADEWTHFFAEQDELQDYFARVMAKHKLAERVRWQIEVVAAEWDDHDGVWCVTLRSADGRTETTRARALITTLVDGVREPLNRRATIDINF